MTDARPTPRWFRFSLRTLFVAIAWFGVWLGWQKYVISVRNDFVNRIVSKGGAVAMDRPTELSWIRRMLGDHAVASIVIEDNAGVFEIGQVRLLFPEADVGRTTDRQFP